MSDANKETNQEKPKNPLEGFFGIKDSASLYNYVLVLLRPKGVAYEIDPLWTIYQSILSGTDVDITTEVIMESLELLFSLIEHTQGKDCNPSPFVTYCDNVGFSLKPRLKEIVAYVSETAENYSYSELSTQIENILTDTVIDSISNNNGQDLSHVKEFIKEFVGLYFQARLEFNKVSGRLLYKMPRFEVFEILKNDEYGLYGFNMYF